MNKIEEYVAAHKKSMFVAIALSVFLGPLGLIYANAWAGVIMTLIAVVGVATGIVHIICWLASILLSIALVSGYNGKVKAAANLIVKE